MMYSTLDRILLIILLTILTASFGVLVDIDLTQRKSSEYITILAAESATIKALNEQDINVANANDIIDVLREEGE